MNWKDFFYFSRRERQGLLVLLILLIGIMIGKFLFNAPQPETVEQPSDPVVENNNPHFSSSEREIPKIENVEPKKKTTPPVGNKETSTTNPEGESESRTYYAREEKQDTHSQQAKTSSLRTEKIQSGTTIELNSADSTSLCKIPGIGPAFSRRIIAYRNLLGGFNKKEQLQEVYGMYEELYEKITPFVEIQADSIRKIPLNIYSLEKLRSHPYINFYQAKIIVEIRKKTGRLENINQLVLLEEFSTTDLEKLEPYLDFEK